MIALQTSINDNVPARRLYLSEAECLVFIPGARYLIEKYSSAYWKNSYSDPDFVWMELALARRIKMETRCVISRDLKIKWIAGLLEVNPFRLRNDPDLPF